MSQPRSQSLAEAVTSTAAGFLISLFIFQFIKWLWSIETSFADDTGIIAVFTAASIVRVYLLRRLFNQLHIRQFAARRRQLAEENATFDDSRNSPSFIRHVLADDDTHVRQAPWGS